jgi:hypothetical protein
MVAASSFEQLVGAAGDVKELEYISALHQTDPREVRKDGSIKGMYGRNTNTERVIVDTLQSIHLHDAFAHSFLRLLFSLPAEDIRLFLSSRYGIRVTDEEVFSTILQGLGGGSEKDECIDVMELVAILLIPTLIKAADQRGGYRLPSGVVPAPAGLLEYVLKIILHDVSQV